ncbi:MAG: peptidase M20, partial [Acidobacteriaceae bacterium]|nr:peptidase M20 [Acidobacteriaceae bacterium]
MPVVLLSGFALLFPCLASPQNAAAEAARTWRQQHETQILQQFIDLLSLPNLASDADNVRRNASAIQQLLTARGVKNRLLETTGAPPVVYGEILTPG